jgi:alginate O-acetyltransferase complex protein AlgI
MAFLSIEFFAFQALVAIVFYVIPTRWRTAYLLAVSYLLYALWSPTCAALIFTLSLLVFTAGFAIAKAHSDKQRRMILIVALSMTAGTLVTFKLFDASTGLLLPLGLSYYSFKLISYLLEIYWGGPPEASLTAFLLYPSFFPQIVSGPIQRAPDFLSQVRERFVLPASYPRIEEGFRLILGGLMLKLIFGDRLALFIAAVDGNSAAYSWATLLLTTCCYSLQLYADFAGYSNIAIGLGKIFGIDSPPNFAAPFAASSVPEMWRRWHMSLTSWVTDYVFVPLQMALRDLRTLGLMASITSSMVLVGIWHGLTINFLAFGVCHALFICVTALTTRQRQRLFGESRCAHLVGQGIGIVTTFALMTFSQIFWRLKTWDEAIDRIRHLSGLSSNGSLDLLSFPANITDGLLVSIPVVFFIGAGCPGIGPIKTRFERIPNWLRFAGCLLLLSALRTETGSSFIYGQF